jgi:cytosine/adenosine deaminase-related metal-dependent hydrolase
MPGLLLRDGRPWRAGGPADLLIRDGVIAEIGAGLDAGDAEVVDLGARALGLEPYGLVEGAPADLVVVAADTPAHAVVTRPPRDLVLKAGRVVARAGMT